MIDTELTPALPQVRFTLTRRSFITGLILASLNGHSHSANARENFLDLPQISLRSATDEDKPVFNKDASSSESLINYEDRVELGKVEGNWANEIDVGQDGFVFTSTLEGENRDSTVLTFGHFDSNPESFTKKRGIKIGDSLHQCRRR